MRKHRTRNLEIPGLVLNAPSRNDGVSGTTESSSDLGRASRIISEIQKSFGIPDRRYSSGSTLTIEAPWLLPAQKVTGVVELSTNTRRILVLRGSS